jgi:hypothetical protein
MSSPYVRETLRRAWGDLTPSLPFVETINTLVDPADTDVPIWGTFVFDTVSRAPQTMGSQPWMEEQGTATVVLMGQAGVLDDDVAFIAGSVVTAWDGWIDDTKNLWIQSVDAPRPPDLEAVGDNYRLTVTLNYRYQTRGGP